MRRNEDISAKQRQSLQGDDPRLLVVEQLEPLLESLQEDLHKLHTKEEKLVAQLERVQEKKLTIGEQASSLMDTINNLLGGGE
jgi:hypothetical protein